jgi:hypothetical protein
MKSMDTLMRLDGQVHAGDLDEPLARAPNILGVQLALKAWKGNRNLNFIFTHVNDLFYIYTDRPVTL